MDGTYATMRRTGYTALIARLADWPHRDGDRSLTIPNDLKPAKLHCTCRETELWQLHVRRAQHLRLESSAAGKPTWNKALKHHGAPLRTSQYWAWSEADSTHLKTKKSMNTGCTKSATCTNALYNLVRTILKLWQECILVEQHFSPANIVR